MGDNMNFGELYIILQETKPSDAIIKNEDAIFKLIPELKKCKGFNQNNPWHPYDVYNHILHVVDNVDNDLTLRLIALFHDIGKPETYTEDEKGIGHFKNHWLVSQNIFDYYAIKYDIINRKSISLLIKYHDYSLDKLEEIEKYFTNEELIMLFKIKKADLLAQSSKYHYLLNDIDKKEKELLKKRGVYSGKRI